MVVIETVMLLDDGGNFLFFDPNAEVTGWGDGATGAGVTEKAGGGDGDFAAFEVFMKISEDVAATGLASFASSHSSTGFGEELSIDIKSVAFACKNVSAASYDNAVAVAFFEGREVDGGAGEEDFFFPE